MSCCQWCGETLPETESSFCDEICEDFYENTEATA